jgi:actin-related protein
LGEKLPLFFFRFAAGKGSALVIDIGHSTASVTPVVDGFVLRKGTLPTLLDT